MSQLSDRHSQFSAPSLTDASITNPQERAMAHLAHRGVLIVDDTPSQLQALHDVCADFLEIPVHNIRVIHVPRNQSLHDIATTLEAALRNHLQTTGAPFASIITDYNFSSEINSIDVWKNVEARFKDEHTHQSWLATGRVLVTANDRDSLIRGAEQSGLIDAYLHKPLQLAALSAALCTSVLKRLP
jgi:hypothetical protein